MLSQCLNRVPKCIDRVTGLEIADADSPFRNLSSEAIDTQVFWEQRFPDPNPDDPRWVYRVQGCLRMCESSESYEEALLCAQRQAYECVVTPDTVINWPDWPVDNPPWSPPDPGIPPAAPGQTGGGPPGGGGGKPPPPGGNPPPPGPPGPAIFFSAEAACSVTCPDGSVFTKTIAAGKFVAPTQALADKYANEYACLKARAERICLGDLNVGVLCLYHDMDPETITISGQNAPYAVSTVGGAEMPDGLSYELNPAGNIITISGRPTAAGQFSIGFEAADSLGNSNRRDYLIPIIGISPEPGDLGDWPMNEPYTKAFIAEGSLTSPILWSAGNLPTGLTIDPSTGVVSGTPTVEQEKVFTITMQDATGLSCANVYELRIVDCATAVFAGIDSNDIKLSTFNLSGVISKAVCERAVTFKTYNWRASGSGCSLGSIVLTVRDGSGVQQATYLASMVNPFPAEINQAVTVPAQFLPTDLEWTWELVCTVTVPGYCTVGTFTWEISGL